MVGSGESGSDICNEISKYASATGLAIRGKHGHLIPRKQADGRVTDLNTNRCRYSNPYVLGDWVGYVNQLVRGGGVLCGVRSSCFPAHMWHFFLRLE